MLRWLVRRVVKYILEELSSSKDFRQIVEMAMSKIVISSGEKTKTPMIKNGVAPIADDNETMAQLANVMLARSKGIEMTGVGATEEVKSDGKTKQNMVNLIGSIGD